MNTPSPSQNLLVYKSSPLRLSNWLLPVVVFLAAGLAPLLYGAYRGAYGFTKFGTVAAASWSVPWLIAGFAGTAAAISICLWLVLLSHRQVELSSQEIVFKKFGMPPWWTFRLPWDAVASLQVETRRLRQGGVSYRMTIRPKKGLPIILRDDHSGALPGGLPKLPDLASHIKARVYARLVPGLYRDFAAGRWLSFGPLSIHKDYLRFGRYIPGAPIPWNRVQRLAIDSGHLVVELDSSPNHQPKHVPVSNVPNLELLLQLFDQGPQKQ
jgi:hypothetical protein